MPLTQFLNEYTITVDIKRQIAVASSIPTYHQTDSASLLVNILNNGKPYEFGEADRYVFHFKRKDGEYVNGLGAIDNGLIRYNLGSTERALPGTVQVSISLYLGESKISTQPFPIRILPDYEDGIPSEEGYSVLQELFIEVDTVKTTAQQKADYAQQQGDYAKNIRDQFGHKGEYSPSTAYKDGNVVSYGGISYMCILNTTAGITPLNGTYWSVLSSVVTNNEQTWVAGVNQKTFTITNGQYVVGGKNIRVTVGGVPQVSGVNFTESSETTISFSEVLPTGVSVHAQWTEGALSITKPHNSGHYSGGQDELDVTKLKNFKENVTDQFTSVTSQLADIATLSSSKYGIVGDGTDETSKIVSMLNAVPSNGGKLIFDKSKEITINGTSLLNISNKKNIVIEGLRAKGTSEAVFQISNGSKNITFRDCVFKDFGQVVYLFACEEVTVDNCVFDSTGYGVIQHIGTISNNVKVVNCTAKNMKKDFIEANCTVSAPSKNWTIAHNHYLGGSGYPTISTEQRFVGITGVKNVLISHNIIENVCGDSAIHLEDVGGNITIDHNIIDNVVGGANNAYIWIIHNEKTALINGNTFLRSDTSLTQGLVYGNSNPYTNNIKLSNNIVRGTNKNLIGFQLASHTNASVIGNTFEDCDKAIVLSYSNDMLISSNEFIKNNYGVFANAGLNQGACNDIQLSGNKFRGTVTACVEIRRNTSGTQACSRWLVQGNSFVHDARGFDTVDFTCVGNTIAAGKTLDFGATQYVGSTGYVGANNRTLGSNALSNKGWIVKGSQTFSGDGSTNSKTITHNLGTTPTYVHVIPASTDAGNAGIKYVTADVTYITYYFNTAPITGANNVKVYYKAEL